MSADRVPVLSPDVMAEALGDLFAHVSHEGLEPVISECGLDKVALASIASAEVRAGDPADTDEQQQREASAFMRGTLYGLKLASRMGQRR